MRTHAAATTPAIHAATSAGGTSRRKKSATGPIVKAPIPIATSTTSRARRRRSRGRASSKSTHRPSAINVSAAPLCASSMDWPSRPWTNS